jgi:hypothetical protein
MYSCTLWALASMEASIETRFIGALDNLDLAKEEGFHLVAV